jgi:hypothetical protein
LEPTSYKDLDEAVLSVLTTAPVPTKDVLNALLASPNAPSHVLTRPRVSYERARQRNLVSASLRRLIRDGRAGFVGLTNQRRYFKIVA